eukprot:6220965-Ditylum_brightwellii.AAC.1
MIYKQPVSKLCCLFQQENEWFHQQVEVPQVNLDQSNLWLNQADLGGETDALICASQEQALSTNYVRNMIYKQP